MNGSNSAVGRQGPASAVAAAGLSAAEQALLADGPWPWSSCGRCWLCQLRRETTASCERDERVSKVLEGRHMQPPIFGRTDRTMVCKDCCIAAMDGHGCPWWDLCWRD